MLDLLIGSCKMFQLSSLLFSCIPLFFTTVTDPETKPVVDGSGKTSI